MSSAQHKGLAAALIVAASTAAASTAVAQTAIPPSAKDFALSVAQSDQYEIAAAQDASTQSRNPQVRAFAQEMIQDHRRLSESLRQAAAASRLTPPFPAMSSDQAAMLSALQSLRGADFDKAYAKQQVIAHQAALDVELSYADGGADPVLRRAAQSSLPTIQHHLDMAQQLTAALGKS
jgi:putative membrane protein